ncbi:MAG: hypothetical protein KC588_04910, partial [Nitrospira sp.]|nr:hypothetical protein [Nitrospira sp.]
WRNESFRGYADYMQSQEFWDGLEELMATRRCFAVAIMCVEGVLLYAQPSSGQLWIDQNQRLNST